MRQLILGSNSPRRKELLAQLGFDFEVRINPIDEIIPEGISIINGAEYLALQKNKAIARAESEIVLTADTVVICDDRVLGKPANANEAAKILCLLSDKTHKVITGVCISSCDQVVTFSSTTKVTFAAITAQEANRYIMHFNPIDKAGAYGIQEWIGLALIRDIQGSFFNVVGLPTDRVYDALTNNFKFEPLKLSSVR